MTKYVIEGKISISQNNGGGSRQIREFVSASSPEKALESLNQTLRNKHGSFLWLGTPKVRRLH